MGIVDAQLPTIPPERDVGGLRGIGKTQTVLEYAYRFRTEYQAVLWARAETCEMLLGDMIALTKTIEVEENDEQGHNGMVSLFLSDRGEIHSSSNIVPTSRNFL